MIEKISIIDKGNLEWDVIAYLDSGRQLISSGMYVEYDEKEVRIYERYLISYQVQKGVLMKKYHLRGRDLEVK